MSIKNRFHDVKTRVQSYLEPRPRFRLLLMCFFVIFAIFPDVFVARGSLSMLDKFRVPQEGREHRSIYPEKSTIYPEDGLYDSDGAALQSEPMISFLKHSIYSFQSPYWNPFSGAGSVGPETMVDIKFAPTSVMSAMLGGSSLSFHLVWILQYLFALYCLSRLCLDYFGLSRKATLAVGFAFMLSGYATANLSSNTNQVYYLFPFALLSVLNFSRQSSVTNYLWLVLAYTLPLMISFFPTTVLMLTITCVFAAAASCEARSNWKERVRLVLTHATAPVLAGMICAFQYLPLIETLKFTAALDTYGLRTFYPANWRAALSLFAAKSFFESYGNMDQKLVPFLNNVIFHFGILVGMISALAFFSRSILKNLILGSACFLLFISLGRIFGLPGLSYIIDLLPFYKNVGGQYWWIVVGCTFPIVFAHGLRKIESADFKPWPAFLIAIVFLASLAYIAQFYGWPVTGEAPITRLRATFYVSKALLVLGFGLWFVLRMRDQSESRFFPIPRSQLMTLFVAVLFLEMIGYANSVRVTRTDLFANPPEYVRFIQDRIGLHRIANFAAHGIPSEVGSGFQIQQVEFFGMNIIPRYNDLCQRGLTNHHDWTGIGFCANRNPTLDPNVNPDLLNLLGVRYILTTRFMPRFEKYFEDNQYPKVFETVNVRVFENPHVFPRAFGVHRVLEAPKTPDTLKLSAKSVAFSDDPQLIKEAKEKGIVMGAAAGEEPSSLFEKVKIAEYRNAYVKLEADFERSGLLVLPDNWHPNWTATVDGVGAYIGRVNETFRGVVLPQGKHTVEMRYRPKTLVPALGITAFALLTVLVLYVFRRRIDGR